VEVGKVVVNLLRAAGGSTAGKRERTYRILRESKLD
jgi:hypothetical protein